MGYYHKFLTLFACIFVFGEQPADAVNGPADHQALRNILGEAKEAINTNDFSIIKPYLTEDNFTAIAVNNQKFTNISDLEAFWTSLYAGDNPMLKSIEVSPQADELTEFLDENTGIVQGTSMDTYNFADGKTRRMETRWTAVVQKKGGDWKLAKVHFSTDFMDNPYLHAATAYLTRMIWIAGLAGLALGALLMRVFRRRRRPGG